MALYVSAATRLRRTILIASAAAVVAFALGWLVGHQQVPSIEGRVTDVQESANDAATGIERLDIEYEQVLDGTDSLDDSVLTPIDELRVELQRDMDRAPWLSGDQRAVVLDALAGLRQDAVDGASLEQFNDAIAEAVAAVRATFGLAE